MYTGRRTLWKIVLAIFGGTVVLCPSIIGAIATYQMNELCDKEIPMIVDHVFQGQLLLNLDVWQENSTSLVDGVRICDLTISAWYTWPQLLIHVEELASPCHQGYFEMAEVSNDWRDEGPIIGLPAKLCGTVPPVGTFTTRTRFLRVRYASSTSQPFRRTLRLVFTAYRTDRCPEYGFRCQNGHCIDSSLECNGYNACGDNSDCFTNTLILVGIIGGSLAAVGVLTVVVCIYCCRRRKRIQREREEKEAERTTETSIDADVTAADLTGRVV